MPLWDVRFSLWRIGWWQNSEKRSLEELCAEQGFRGVPTKVGWGTEGHPTPQHV